MKINHVDGVYTKHDYDNVLQYLDSNNPILSLFWRIGCETGYRVSDILNLRVNDIYVRKIAITERKTQKVRPAKLSAETFDLLQNHINLAKMGPESLIFGGVTRQYVWRCIRKAGQAVGLPRLNLEHIPRARHMRGDSSLAPLMCPQCKQIYATHTNQPHSNISKAASNALPPKVS